MEFQIQEGSGNRYKVLLTSTLFGIFLILIPLFLRASENSEKPENYLSVGLPGLTNPNRGLDYASWRISPIAGWPTPIVPERVRGWTVDRSARGPC
jgi:hypothetical protein